MSESDAIIIEIAQQLREDLAGNTWPASQARLFSQYTRLEYQQPGLTSWQESEATQHLEDAIRLLEAASVEREAGHFQWQDSVRRAAELLEWLSHPQTNPHEYPLQLLSAAAYQIAGYPARASGLLSYPATENQGSLVLHFLLKGEFTRLTTEMVNYWSRSRLSQYSDFESEEEAQEYQIQQKMTDDIIGIIGILCVKMRWGEAKRLGKALKNFDAIERFLLYGKDSFSWLLAKLTSEVITMYATSALRDKVFPLQRHMNENGHIALERYLRQCYFDNKNIAWPSQVKGIQRIAEETSFALCTPTGSGKTSVAELAIIQSLFSEHTLTPNVRNKKAVSQILDMLQTKPLIIYLVPSRALATEVEVKLSRVLHKLDASIIVTGLYGGTDWGPTDAWLTANDRTVLICTYEKGEALIRFLGPLFLQRVSLVVVDEAHSVQFTGSRDQLSRGENRALRLEMLGSRLFRYLDYNGGRVIALSAVATGIEQTLASWATRRPDADPTQTSYRSVRQLIGRLICVNDRQCEIRYDLVDGARVSYKQSKRADDVPYVPQPFEMIPEKSYSDAAMKRRSPHVFWAAIHFAKQDSNERQHAVLISITQHIDFYAKDFLELLDKHWNDIQLPVFFKPPKEKEDFELWDQCLRACEDYLGTDSYTYQLLKKGVVVHQGSMPGAIGRLFTELIQRRFVHIVLATSTLSEGVNLPFETILIPSLKRWVSGKRWVPYRKKWANGGDEVISPQEFGNLVGRSGRPGYGTEGRSLVVVNSNSTKNYDDLIAKISSASRAGQRSIASSPLAGLILYLEDQWLRIANQANNDDFFTWLEQAAPLDMKQRQTSEEMKAALESLDTLDGLLLSTIVESEQNRTLDDLEEHLKSVWRCTYAYHAVEEERKLENIFVRRGKAITTRIYPDPQKRKNLYCTGLPPRHGSRLIAQYSEIKQYLQRGYSYATWDRLQKIGFVRGLIDRLLLIPGYRVEQSTSQRWDVILRWWLDCNASIAKKPSDITKWHKFIRENFIYRVNWGIGSIIALASDEIFGEQLASFTLNNWPLIGLPWIVLWLKELLTWGTTDPVAAYLLANKMAVTRMEAESVAANYYTQNQSQTFDPNDILSATRIRDWAQANFNPQRKLERKEPPRRMSVHLERDFSHVKQTKWRVLPVLVNNILYWYDPAGFTLAYCGKPSIWDEEFVNTFDFVLDSQNSIVISGSYIEREVQ